MKTTKKKIIASVAIALSLFGIAGCANSKTSSGKKPLTIYTNADTEAIDVMKATLDNNGFKNDYKFQEFGSSDLNAKVVAEGKNMSADLVTLSTFYLDSAQKNSHAFVDWNTPKDGVNKRESFQAPILGNEGAIIINTDALKQAKLPEPKSIKDLAAPIYKGQLSFPDLNGSTTGWLMVQALIQQYGEKEAQTILTGMIKNAGSMITQSGSAPLQNVESGQVAVAFGLRAQGEKDTDKMPLKVVEPTEGNFVLTESVAVVNHKTLNSEAEKAAELLATKTRTDMIKQYPVALFKGEQAPVDKSTSTEHIKFFNQPLTTDLLKTHIAIFDKVKAEAN
ncbi:extracellular solute-binding protein [Lactococcus lactis subsp. lactis]|uniref:ABC transporter substrate-binding protein n=1 Tax=Lactococcus lactis TaxID=1358 RepID=UPI00223AB8A3|nr:ABC transporter substrate-binding protein [Lactococcus lactis]MCT0017226.1 extracellular solute-binding protein [Lactococcus lactis subsp. lactis]